MFGNLFSQKEFQSKTGFFKIENSSLIEIENISGNGSINDCIQTIGFPKNHIFITHSHESDKIACLGFKTFSKEPLLVLTKGLNTKISYSDVLKSVKKVDWDFEYSSLNIEDLLEEGIQEENFDLKFLKSVIDLKPEIENLYKSEKYSLYFHFENEILKAVTSSEWDSSTTKFFKSVNDKMISKMNEEAKQFHNDDIDAMEEVNRNTMSLMNIPNAMKNKYLALHRKTNGNINFYNLLITHYTKECNQDELLFMNKGRYKKIDEGTFLIGKFYYQFDDNKKLVSIYNN